MLTNIEKEAILEDFEEKKEQHDFHVLKLQKEDGNFYTDIYTNTNHDLINTIDKTTEISELINNCNLTLSINNVETYFSLFESLYILNDKYLIITIENSQILIELKEEYDLSITHILEPYENRQIIIKIN